MRKFVLPTAIGSTIGAGLGMVTNLMPVYWPAASHSFVGALFWLAMTAFLVPLPSVAIWYVLEIKQFRHIYGVVSLLIFWSFCYVAFSAIDRRVSAHWGQLPQPDVSLCLANSKLPTLVLKNLTEQVAENIRYSFALFDLDSPDRDRPLPLPSASFDFIPSKRNGGPMDIFTNANGAIKSGDRIVGSIGVSCPKCITGRTYWVSVVWGQGGWYSQINGESSGGIMVSLIDHPVDPLRNLSSEGIASLVSKVPDKERISIQTRAECEQK